ncbi:MAG: T9SS type A sorting domain-containing protein [Fibromonadaceae bacterium]|jgi:hypothetical protein|nr:T9SS type A sorting domain-containing protein [Fibromonadaceae bacterium]
MKKAIFLAVFAMAVLASQAMAQTWVNCPAPYDGYCKWAACNPINTCTGGTPGSDCANQGTDCEAIYNNCLNSSNDHTVWSNSTCTIAKETGTVKSCGSYCKWSSGCSLINTDPTGKYGAATDTCEDAISNCAEDSPDKTVYSDAACTNVSLVGGADYCKDGSGKQYYCQYTGNDPGCYEIKKEGRTCEQALDHCKTTTGKIFINVNPSALSETNSYGNGVVCSANGGTEVTNVSTSSSSNVSGGGASSSSGGSSDPCIANPGNAGCPNYCAYHADAPECSNDACVKNPYAAGCPMFCSANPTATGCTACTSNPTAPGCPGFCAANPNAAGCNAAVCTANPAAAGCPGFCAANPTAVGCLNDPCTTNPAAPGCSGFCTANPTAPGCGTPIISYNSKPTIGLNVVHFAGNLQIASGKNATVSLFDLRGKQIFSQKILSGTTVISLKNQKQGVYYAVVKAGSQKQTVKVTVR